MQGETNKPGKSIQFKTTQIIPDDDTTTPLATAKMIHSQQRGRRTYRHSNKYRTKETTSRQRRHNRSILFRFLLFIALISTTCSSLTLESQPIDTEEQYLELPVDGHLSAESLPWELSNSYSADCTCDRPSTNCSHDPTPASCGARIFYLVGIHNNRTLNDAVYLFRGIRDARNTILFHMDVKFDFGMYEQSILKQEIEACPCGSHVEVASVHNASWSSWSMNLPTLWGMNKAVTEYSGKWDVFVNLSGDTLPVYTPDRVAKLFGGPLAGINFITSSACETGLLPTPISAFPKHWHKRGHYSQHPAKARLEYRDDDGTRHQNVTLEIYFGSQWMSLQPDWCSYLVAQLERPDSLPSRFRHYLIETEKLMTDETFIPTLLMHLFPETIPKVDEDYRFVNNDQELDMYAIRYERMDEHVPTSSGWFPTEQRYQVPESSGVDMPRPWGPYFLGVYDLENIQRSGALYIRKVATAIDHNLFNILPVDDPEDIPPISWPKEAKISPVPDWEKTVWMMKKKAELAAEKKQKAEKEAQKEQAIGEQAATEEEELSLSEEEDDEGDRDEEWKDDTVGENQQQTQDGGKLRGVADQLR
jgi:hypothetical protein